MKLLLTFLLVTVSVFAATVSEEETIKISTVPPTNIYIKPICIDGYKFIITVTGQGAINTIQVFEGSYTPLNAIRCKKEQQ